MAEGSFAFTNLSATPETPGSGKTSMFVNTNKKPAIVDDAGTVSALESGTSATQVVAAGNKSTTSLTEVMGGYAGAITPQISGRVLIMFTSMALNGAPGDGTSCRLRYGTGAAPALGDAATGTALGSFKNSVTWAGSAEYSLQCCFVVTGLTVGTAYWIDIGFKAVTGSTATLQAGTLNAIEI